jgi:hypothetical protein
MPAKLTGADVFLRHASLSSPSPNAGITAERLRSTASASAHVLDQLHAEFEGAQPMDIREAAGEAKYVAATPKHTAHNTGKTRIRFLVTELK